MVGSAGPVRHSFAEYIELEDATSGKHEFLDGQIFAMAGGTPEHSALITSTVTQLANQLRGRSCRVHASELRIRVDATGLATYPDVSSRSQAFGASCSSPTIEKSSRYGPGPRRKRRGPDASTVRASGPPSCPG